MKALTKFNLHSNYVTYRDNDNYKLPNVSACIDNNDVHYNYIKNYMKLTALSDGDITITIPASVNSTHATSISYSKDMSNWTKTLVNNTTQTITIPVNTGDIIYLKGIAKKSSINYSTNTTINSTANINASGNTMSLFYGNTFEDKIIFTTYSSYNLCRLFYNNTHLIDVKDLILPATTLTNACYDSMFYGCTNLTTAPELPATTLNTRCYEYMFMNCTSLTSVPELPATTLAEGCYVYMFGGCTSLTTAPELPATTLAQECYGYMFHNCTNLTTAPELPATTLANKCYQFMFQLCTNLTSAPELPATTLTNYCYWNMFYKCTSLTTAPVLPATTLASNCYEQIFRKCSKLNNITMLATDISATKCLNDWVNGVASKGTFTKAASMTTLPTSGTSGIPSGWTVVDYTTKS